MDAIRIDVRHNLNDLARELDTLQRAQIPFASALALTATARLTKNAAEALIVERFDRPTPFTQRGVGVTPARKDNLQAMVFVKDIQAGYLALEETGGVRLPVKTALIQPVDIKLNQYGNIPRGALQRGMKRANVFVGKITFKNGGTIGGFWQRLPNHRLRLLAKFKPEQEYKPIFGYHERTGAVVLKELPAQFRAALVKAMKTARR